MLAAIARTGPYEAILCRVDADNPSEGLERLKKILEDKGMPTEPDLQGWIRWRQVFFSVQEFGGEEQLNRTIGTVRQLERTVPVADDRFSSLLHSH